MKVYILIPKDEEKPAFDLPEYYGSKRVRAYYSKKRAKTFAKKNNCAVIALDAEHGEEIELDG